MRLHKTGHHIADAVSDLIGDLPDGNYNIVYGILRHSLFREDKPWFECDRGFWDASHYSGNYRLSFRGTQPRYDEYCPFSESHGVELEPWWYWCDNSGYVLICPPTGHVCDFFNINYAAWMNYAIRKACIEGKYIIRGKGAESPVEWDKISKVITFNSTIGFEALRRGIPVISDPVHSTIGSYTRFLQDTYCDYDRNKLFSFASAHMFKLNEKDKICRLIKHYTAG